MNTYVVLLSFTGQGIRNIKDSPNRLDAAKQAFAAVGASIKDYYLVMGQYDAVVIIEAPNDEVAAALALATGAQGNVKTETLRAFPEADYRKIVASLP
jgi:uncharacterized protein with GYD domain